jgi:hypothetical protein
MTAIGTRYTTAHLVRRDDRAGVYEELNSPLVARSEGDLQRALLAQVERRNRWPDVLIAACGVAALVAVVAT